MNMYHRRIHRIVILATATFAGAVELSAANYSVPWHRIAAGGVVSQAGAYRSVGTIGQADAGSLRSVSLVTLQTESVVTTASADQPAISSSSRNFALVGGFHAVTLQTPGAPTLAIMPDIPGGFTWATTLPAYTLQQSATIGPDARWADVEAPVTTNGNVFTVTVPRPAGTAVMFYRLRK